MISWRQKLSYGMGHILNDLSSAMWFSFLIIYLQNVRSFSEAIPGHIILIGQVADGICTPLIGYESDRIERGILNYGKRKSLHLIGTLSVIVSFPFLFIPCIGCYSAPDWSQMIYLIPFVVIFQFGWAATQISHLSLIPYLSSNESVRTELNSIRYGFSVLATILVYGVSWLLMGIHTSSKVVNNLSPADASKFSILVISMVAFGTVTSLLFHMFCKEPSVRQFAADAAADRSNGTHTDRSYDDNARPLHRVESISALPVVTAISWTQWFRMPNFYLVCVVYTCTRVAVNVQQVVLPLYLTDSLELNKEFIGIIPLVSYVSGLIAALIMRPFNAKLGRQLAFTVSSLMVGGACFWLEFIKHTSSVWQVLVACIVLGFGSSSISITALSMITDLIGSRVGSGAFVYGFIGLAERLANGLAVEVIQLTIPMGGIDARNATGPHYHTVMATVPGAAAVLAFVLVVLAWCVNRQHTLKSERAALNGEKNGLLNGSGRHESSSKPAYGAS